MFIRSLEASPRVYTSTSCPTLDLIIDFMFTIKTLDHTMTEPAYITISTAKWQQVTSLIPAEWRLDDKYIPRAMRLSPLESVHQLHEFEEGYVTNLLDVPRQCGILSAREVRITEGYDVQGLLNAIAQKRLSAEEVALAFCKVCHLPPH